MTPSEKFSATVSTAARVTPPAVRFSVSRPTMRETCLRAFSKSPASRAFCTFVLSDARSFIARHCQQSSDCMTR